MITIPVKVTYTAGDWEKRWQVTGLIIDELGKTHRVTASSGQWDIAVALFRQQSMMHLPDGARFDIEIRETDTGSKIWASPVEARVGRDGRVRVVPRFPLRDEPYCLGVKRYA